MRTAWIAFALVALVGCMQAPASRDGMPPEPGFEPRSAPGKVLVRDVRTGDYLLVDDPRADRGPAPAVRPRAPRPPAPEVPVAPGAPMGRVHFGISLDVWGMDVDGDAAGYWGYDAGLRSDLRIESATGVSLDFSLLVPRGPRFRLGLTFIGGEGEDYPACHPEIYPYPPASLIEPATLDVFMLDLAVAPAARGGKWGYVALETGVRYARAILTSCGEEWWVDGAMLTLGGELGLSLAGQTFGADVSALAGLGGDAACLQFDLGISLRPARFFSLRLGYRFLALSLFDENDQVPDMSFGAAFSGPALEAGLTF
jgi:hypothetical protein